MPRRPNQSFLFAGFLATVLLLVLPAAQGAQLPPAVAGVNYGLREVGAGRLSWLGRPVYEASLWTTHGRFEGYADGSPVALSLWYERSFSRDQLLRITRTAWRLLDAATPAQRKAWLAALESVWRDVGPGDNQTAIVLPGKATIFYDQRELLGQIDDPEFGPAFLSIWLDSRSVVGDLRVQLLGAR
jgi:hypothetical protein